MLKNCQWHLNLGFIPEPNTCTRLERNSALKKKKFPDKSVFNTCTLQSIEIWFIQRLLLHLLLLFVGLDVLREVGFHSPSKYVPQNHRTTEVGNGDGQDIFLRTQNEHTIYKAPGWKTDDAGENLFDEARLNDIVGDFFPGRILLRNCIAIILLV